MPIDLNKVKSKKLLLTIQAEHIPLPACPRLEYSVGTYKRPVFHQGAISINFFYQLLLRLPLKRPGSQLLKAVFKGFLPAATLASSKNAQLLGAVYINFFFNF